MKTRFFILIAGLAFLMYSCDASNDAKQEEPEIVIPEPEPEPEPVPEPEPKPDLFHFTQGELDLIDSLINLVPVEITDGFKDKFRAWGDTWSNRFFILQSSTFIFSYSCEYDHLLRYCEKYGKAMYPMVIAKFTLDESSQSYPREFQYSINLLKDFLNAGSDYCVLYDSINEALGDNWQYWLTVYAKKLLADEKDNIILSIQDCKQGLHNESSLTALESNQIASFINLIPATITDEFEEKFQACEQTWGLPEFGLGRSRYHSYQSGEYQVLLEYCEKSGKAVWPLIIDKISQNEILVLNLFADLSEAPDYYIEESKFIVLMNCNSHSSSYTLLMRYCKRLLVEESDSILSAIQDL